MLNRLEAKTVARRQRSSRHAAAWLSALLGLGLALPATAEKTDVVVLVNGDRITGEIKTLEKGRLKYSTDHMGTIYIEWDKIVRITSKVHYEVETVDGEFYFGALETPPEEGQLHVVGEAVHDLAALDVVGLTPIEDTVLARIDGSINFGFNFTQAKSAEQISLAADATYHTERFEASVAASAIVTDQDDAERAQRASLNFGYQRFRNNRWFNTGVLQFQSNEELGIDLRTLVGYGIGRFLIKNSRAEASFGAGLSVSQEQTTELDNSNQSNIEAVLTFDFSKYVYDFPQANFGLSLQIFPSLSDSGRWRFEFSADARREIVDDFFLSLSLFDSFDSDPPGEETERNDLGLITSVGWSF